MAFQRKKPMAIGVKAPFPGFIEPALAWSIEKAPNGGRWIHEIKFDGYRVQVHLANTEVKVFTRRGHDWTHRFKKVASDAWHIGAGSAIIDAINTPAYCDGWLGSGDRSLLITGATDLARLKSLGLFRQSLFKCRLLNDPLTPHGAVLQYSKAPPNSNRSETFGKLGP
jgi:hypothetical protein